ncbi:MAG: hypothetical protein L7V87_05080 [Verrucomicrobiales bacterium]|nr:hypothetical protein [Verrucomicrobiales bacterium]
MVARIVTFFLFSLLAADVASQDIPRPTADPPSLTRRLHLHLKDRLPREDKFAQILTETDLDALKDRLLATPEFLSVREGLWAEWLGLENPELQENFRFAIQGTAQVDHRRKNPSPSRRSSAAGESSHNPRRFMKEPNRGG